MSFSFHIYKHKDLFTEMTSYCLQAIWNWMDNYPEEFTDLQKRPNDELAGKPASVASRYCIY